MIWFQKRYTLPIVDSEDEAAGRDGRDRSRSTFGRGHGDNENNGPDSDSKNWSPESKKMALIVEKVVAKQLAPVLKNLNKIVDSNFQVGFKEGLNYSPYIL